MDLIYPPGPTAVPEDLTRPTSAYRNRAWLAMGGLASFVALYFSFAGWFVWTAYRLLSGGLDGDWFWPLIGGGASAFLAIFMLKALFFVKRGSHSEDLEITAGEQPRLFAFLHRLADEAGAPRPHRVYLSGRVNAAVFYDLSIFNLLFPSKKNLEIGLPLVNALTLGEMKAVLAHEFGHFAQRTMAVGTWVYTTQQIAAHVIAKRDMLDSFLRTLSRLDLRIAWVGWGLSLIVWSIRSVMDVVFRGVMLAQRALSREMELQADLVSVSVTGSDALVHALHRLQTADDTWERTLGFAGSELAAKRRVSDLFAVQARLGELLSRVLGDPDFGRVPPLPSEAPHSHRVFKAELAHPPRMWMTHPPSSEREENCKRRYVAAPLDERSAWELFDDIDGLKARMSEHILRSDEAQKVPLDASMTNLEKQFRHEPYDRAYRGAYLGRSIVVHARTTAELYGVAPRRAGIAAEIASLYPESLGADIDLLRGLQSELGSLRALQEGILTAPGGVIRHRGKDLKRAQLPAALEQLEQEVEMVEQRVWNHDRRARTAFVAAAEALGGGWADYLRGLLEVLHYAEHSERDILDAHGQFANVFSIVTADGRVSGSELKRLVSSASILYSALFDVFEQRKDVELDATLLAHLEMTPNWTEGLLRLELNPPSTENIGDWLNIVDSWVRAYTGTLSALRFAALEELLRTEANVAGLFRAGETSPAAPAAPRVPKKFNLRLPGTERERQKRLDWWDRFQTADGTLPTVARLAVAAAIVGAVFMMGGTVGRSVLAIYNGLGRAVTVDVNGVNRVMPPYSSAQLQLESAAPLHVETRTADGKLIEAFDPAIGKGLAKYVYNVAAASPIVEWTAVYGNAPPIPERMLGTSRWITTHADYLFEEPPETISMRGKSETRRVLTGLSGFGPQSAVSAATSDDERAQLISTHARWEAVNSPHSLHWLSLASGQSDFAEILAARFKENPHDVVALRTEQDTSTGADRERVCARHRELAASAPDVADVQYIATRCSEDEIAQDRAFLDLHDKYPQNAWLTMAAGYVHAGNQEWNEAVKLLENTHRDLPPFADAADAELARIRRLSAADEHAKLDDLASRSAYVKFMADIDAGKSMAPGATAYFQLAAGRIEDALGAADDPSVQPRVLRLAAASDGAPAALVDRALALPPEAGIDDGTAWVAFALALREGRDTAPYSAVGLSTGGQRAIKVQRFIETARAAPEPQSAESLLQGMNAGSRCAAYEGGVVVLGQRAPNEWRARARQLCFAYERPYFRVGQSPL